MNAVAFLICLCLSPLGDPPVPDEPRTIWDYAVEMGAGSNMSIPRASLRHEDIERWAELLVASEPQLAFIRQRYVEFVERHNAFVDQEAPQYLSLTHELTAVWRKEGVSTPNFARKVEQVDRANLRMRRQLTALEHTLIDSFTQILTPEQQGRLDTLRHEATRRNCRTFHTDGFGRWLGVELRAVWDESGAMLASPAEREHVSSILDGYEAQLTSLVCGYADLQFQRRTELAKNRVAREHGTISLSESHARYARIMRARLAASRRIRRLNEDTVSRIADSLSIEPASAFVQSAKEAAFPELYPDPAAMLDLTNAIAADEKIDAHIRDTIVAGFNQFKIDYDRICDELEAICVLWGDRTEEGIAGYSMQFLPDALEPLLTERTELSLRYLEKLHELLGPDVLARHADAIPAVFGSILGENEDEQISEGDELTP
jgi:hypothetical protein